MARTGTAKRVMFVGYMLLLHGVLIWLLLDKYVLSQMFLRDWAVGPVAQPEAAGGPQVTPAVLPSLTPTPGPEPTFTAPPPPASIVPGGLIIPVAGVKPEQLVDNFEEDRSEGRKHEAIDIPAPAGTPVMAAADGEIVKFHDSEAGGITIYQISSDRRYFFYYAHLQSRAAGITEGQTVEQGTVIGYVGDTGNAGPGNYHLHFSINLVSDPKRFWDGTSLNPYPILRGERPLD